MKIVSQSADELVLKEGSASGIVVGIAFVIAGAAAGFALHRSNPMVIWIALAVVLIGVGVVLFSASITLDANKRSGQISYQKKRLIGAKDSTYPIADVLRIETRKQWQIQNSAPTGTQNTTVPQPVLVWQSVIVFKDGRELPIDHQKTSSTTTIGPAVLMGGQGKEVALATQLANFLSVPFQETAPPNIGMGVIQF